MHEINLGSTLCIATFVQGGPRWTKCFATIFTRLPLLRSRHLTHRIKVVYLQALVSLLKRQALTAILRDPKHVGTNQFRLRETKYVLVVDVRFRLLRIYLVP